MQVIRRSEVPKYLQGGQLFLSLNPEDDEEISVPADVMKMDRHCELQRRRFLSALDHCILDGRRYSPFCI